MNDCERLFGALDCSKLGNGLCAFALNEALGLRGDVRAEEPFVQSLIHRGYSYCVKVLLLHELDQVTDPSVQKYLHESYLRCTAGRK